MSPIHATAIVDSKAFIDSSAEIGPHVVIEGPVRIGPGTRVMANCYLCGDTEIGAENQLYPGVAIGAPPQHLGYKGEATGVRIGSGNIFREYVTVHRAYHAGKATEIGDRGFFMACSHVAHDCRLGNDVIIANGTLLAGHVTVGDKVVISGNVAVHQFVRIGEFAMIGGLAKIVKDVPPFMMADGDGEIVGVNTVGLRRAGFSPDTRMAIKKVYAMLYRSNMNIPNAVAALERDLGGVPEVARIVEFIRSSSRGISRHGRASSPEE